MNFNRVFGLLTGFVLAVGSFLRPAWADPVVLTVSGQIDGGTVELTLTDLEAFAQHSLRTSTSVTDGRPHFEGFLIQDLLAALGAEGDRVVALALNGYSIEIPMEDFERFDVLGALSMDGERLSPRDYGPIWIVYPRDDHRTLNDIRYDMRWVWQLYKLEVQ